MNNFLLFGVIIIYLICVFRVAFYAEKRIANKWLNNGVVYTLSLAIYCTAWTYYGSIGIAASSGIDFLPIYLGPVIASPLFILVLKKVIRISKQNQISSIADFLSLRYGNNRFIGALVTIVCLIAIIPYISLQLKAISDTFQIMADKTSYVSQSILDDSTFYIALILAVFATFFGTRTVDASKKRRGVVVSVALESLLKLIFFLIIGVYITYILFDGTSDIYNKISKVNNFKTLVTFNAIEDGFNWMYLIMISFFSVFLLPRQFQVSVVENVRQKHLNTAIWLFPLYLLLFNIFVIYIAWAGLLTFPNSEVSEYYALLLPLYHGNNILALVVFLGGFSAVVSMVIVSTIALSTMVSNNLIIPYGFLERFLTSDTDKNSKYIKRIRRVSIFSIIVLSYAFYVFFSYEMSLYSIGLIAFVIICQLAPSFFLGLFWNRGSSRASILSIIVGLGIVCYTFILPFTITVLTGDDSFVENGPFNIAYLKPHALFGIDFLTPPAHAFFWSFLCNLLTYGVVSVLFKGNYRERNYAEMIVDNKNVSILQDNALVWKGEAYVKDIKKLLFRFLGEKKTERALKIFFTKYNIPSTTETADARLVNFSEKLLTGSIGSASAKILISTVVKEEKVTLPEVLKILEESKMAHQRTQALREKSNELSKLSKSLKNANDMLVEKDKQKDEFLDTVAHELKTPITGIRATTELLLDEDDEMPMPIKQQFLNNILQDSERLSRLIQNILDFEKLSTGRDNLDLKEHSIKQVIESVLNTMLPITQKNNISILFTNTNDYHFLFDKDRIVQVLTNLLSNAIKFCEPENGKIEVDYKIEDEYINIYVRDNGKGVPQQDIEFIFDKFYQSKNQNIVKPVGSGLGLAICKQIITMHDGDIWVKNNKKSGVTFGFKLPFI